MVNGLQFNGEEFLKVCKGKVTQVDQPIEKNKIHKRNRCEYADDGTDAI